MNFEYIGIWNKKQDTEEPVYKEHTISYRPLLASSTLHNQSPARSPECVALFEVYECNTRTGVFSTSDRLLRWRSCVVSTNRA
ncbi:unnamed protein product [Cercopithifilaria johnstoni]|uniref:Uncharacterized protein n=1 Tax=Cercopithifilaria johnstoni TaxID=2874296 RepID=A0A8J2QA71_9BILA|nr:unnamed protein product [Cercopithifilaria johnstoni]